MADENKTALDQALEKYLQDDSKQGEYYELILNNDFYIPLNSHGVDGPLDKQQEVSPLVLKSEDKHYMLLFDSEARLAEWAKQATDFVVLTGWKAAEISTPELHWAVNIGSGYAKEFVPDEINWLNETWQKLAE